LPHPEIITGKKCRSDTSCAEGTLRLKNNVRKVVEHQSHKYEYMNVESSLFPLIKDGEGREMEVGGREHGG